MTNRMYGAAAALLVCGGLTIAARAQTSAPIKDDLFAGTEVFAKGASDVTEITMDPDTLGMVAGKDQARAHSMVLNVVRTYSYDKPGMYRIEDVEVFRNKLNSGDWHCSIHTRSLKSGESTDVCNKRRSDDLSEEAIITVEPKSLTFIHTIRKRRPGESELGEMPMLMGLHGMPSMAMLDPQLFLDMQILPARMSMLDSGALQLRLNALKLQLNDKDLQNMKSFRDAPKPPLPLAPALPTAPALPAPPQ